jgi:hypothetical protein
MTGSGAKGRWGRVLRYTFGAVLCLLAGINVLIGTAWYVSLGVLVPGVMMILGRRRIFRPGVTRTTSEIVCRYIPWYEGNAYVLNVALPLLGVAMVAAGYAPGNPAWLRYGGFILVLLTALSGFAAVRMWRRCLLRVSHSALTVRLAAPKDESTEIRRERVESITSKMVPNGVSGESLQVEIAYHTGDLNTDATKKVLLGLQLSVRPSNLLNALVAWKDATDDDPSELLDRIEEILRGRSTVGV